MRTAEEQQLPEKIYPVNYAGFWDFSPDGLYGDSLINELDYPNAEQIAHEMAKRYNESPALVEENRKLREALKECLPFMRAYSSTGFPDKKSRAARDRAESLLSPTVKEEKV